ncbi:MAG: DUF1844 domain-containing protein [Bacteroidota bacterium]|nr:DUF1844 domain-containing protein [Bacteroidota bacterium]
MDSPQNNELLFMQLIMQNQQIAQFALGKTVNPVTNKTEVNLEMGKLIIDSLDMLKVKTNGNLTNNEAAFLDNVLSELKITYLELLSKN